jgi:uncharacterized phiE125 gp8 family phage protein
MSIVLITPPTVEPVTLADLKSQLGLSPTQDTDHVQSDMLSKRLRRFIAVARAECENITRRVFITQTWQLWLDGWPHREQEYNYNRKHYPSILLPKQPFQSIASFTYIDPTGTSQDMAAYGYQTDPGGETQPARLTPPFEQPWPLVRRVPNNISIEFICGYGDTGSTVPPPIIQAILFLAQFYEENGASVDLPVPRVVKNLLDPYCNYVS